MLSYLYSQTLHITTLQCDTPGHSKMVQYTPTNTRHMDSNFLWLQIFGYWGANQTHYSISCSENQMVAWRGVPTPNCSCSCMMVVLSFFQLTTVFTEQSTKLCMGQIKWRYTLLTLSLLSPSQYYQDFKSSQQNSWTLHFLRHHILTFGPTWKKDDTMAVDLNLVFVDLTSYTVQMIWPTCDRWQNAHTSPILNHCHLVTPHSTWPVDPPPLKKKNQQTNKPHHTPHTHTFTHMRTYQSVTQTINISHTHSYISHLHTLRTLH
jgi:hypothetical protein